MPISSMMQGRLQQARKRLIRLLFARIKEKLGIEPSDVEVVIFESPVCHFGFRGTTGDEAALEYKIDV